MEIPYVIKFDETRVPIDNDGDFERFRSNATYSWGVFPSILESINASIDATNYVHEDMTTLRNETNEYKNNAYSYMNYSKEYSVSAQSARNDAIAAKEFIEGYVIPEEATLSSDAINKLDDEHRADVFFGFNF